MGKRTSATFALALALLAGLLALAAPLSASEGAPPPPAAPRIIDGQAIPITDAPWQVALLVSGSEPTYSRQFCGGSIIGAEWILTAAHCVVPTGPLRTTEPQRLTILSGTAQLSQSATGPGLQSAVRDIIAHPEYNSATLENDVALVRLQTPLVTSSTQQAIAIPDFSDWPLEGDAGLASGWGLTIGDDTRSRPTHLQGVTLDVLASPGVDECGEIWSISFYPEVMLCAGIPNEAASTCNGDSGGPLAILRDGGLYLAGLTSWGKAGCWDASVFTRVTAFSSWIAATRSAGLGSIRMTTQPAGRQLCAYAYSPTLAKSGPLAGACSDAAGVITIPSLLPGDYKVWLSTREDKPIGAWWTSAGPVSQRSAAASVSVTAGATASISTVLGTITGTVINGTTGKPQGGITVTLEEVTGIGGQTSTTTNGSGTYSFAVPPGLYRTLLKPRPSDTYRPAGSGLLSLGSLQTLTADLTMLPGAGLSGVVRNLAGRPISGAVVVVHTLVNPTFPDRSTYIMETVSGTDGTFTFRSLPAQPVQVHVQGNPFAPVRYVPEWYHDAQDRAQASTIPLSLTRPYALGPVVLEAVAGTSGRLVGRVSDRSTGEGVAEAEVRLTTEDGKTTLRTTTTDSAGQYEIAGIAPGIYGLDVVPTRSSPYLPSIGDLVTIVGGDTTERATTLEEGGGVIGYVKDAAGKPIPGITVEARISLYGLMITVAATHADRLGQYWFAALPTDREVTFYYTSQGLPTHYRAQWYGGAATVTNADYVTPTAQAVQALADTVMVPGPAPSGGIRGRVTTADGYGLQKVTVTAYSGGGARIASVTTEENGDYEFAGLPAGDVYVRATDDTLAMPGHLAEWYLDATTRQTATPIAVVGDQVTSVATIMLDEGVGFRGVVQDYNTDAPVAATVRIVSLGGAARTLTVTEGTFQLGGLPPGTYVAEVKPQGGYLPMWWELAATQAQATRLESEAGQTRFVAFYVSRTPSDPVVTAVRKISQANRTIEVSWEATVGAGRYQVQRQRGGSWVTIKRTTALAYTDTLPQSIPWSSRVCYRLRVISPGGVAGPWTTECTI